MKVERFEDLICWQKARKLSNTIYALTNQPRFEKDFQLKGQVRAAAVSAMSNIAEGFDRWSRKELIRFLDIAKGSVGEVRSQLYVALDQHYISAEQFEAAKTEALEVSKTVGGLIGYLESHMSAPSSTSVREETAAYDVPLNLPSEFGSLTT